MKFLTKIKLDNTLSSNQKDNDAQLDQQIKKNKAHHKQMTKIQNDPLTFVALQNELASIIKDLAIEIDKDQIMRRCWMWESAVTVTKLMILHILAWENVQFIYSCDSD